MVFVLDFFMGGFFGFKAMLASTQGRHFIDRLVLSIPFFSGLSVEYALSSYCRTLATTIDSGIPLIQAMRMCRGTVNNLYLEQKVVAAIKRVEEGGSFTESLKDTGFFRLWL